MFVLLFVCLFVVVVLWVVELLLFLGGWVWVFVVVGLGFFWRAVGWGGGGVLFVFLVRFISRIIFKMTYGVTYLKTIFPKSNQHLLTDISGAKKDIVFRLASSCESNRTAKTAKWYFSLVSVAPSGAVFQLIRRFIMSNTV